MESPAQIARSAGFELDTVDVSSFESVFDIHGEDRLLATLFYDGKPVNAYLEPPGESDEPVGWCIQFSDELMKGEAVVWRFRCPADRLDLATAMACGMVQQRLLQKDWWEPLPDHRIWEEDITAQVKGHHRFEIEPPRSR